MTFPRSSGLANNAAINPDGGITITPQGGMLVGGRSVLMLNDAGTAVVDGAGNVIDSRILPSGDTSGVTDRIAFQAAATANGVLNLGPGVFYLDGTYVQFPGPGAVNGQGGSIGGDAGTAVSLAATTINVVSPTGGAFQVNDGGVTFQNIAIINTAGSIPTAGAGILGIDFTGCVVANCTILGFWNNLDVGGCYYTVVGNHLYDAVNYYMYHHSPAIKYDDHGDFSVADNVISGWKKNYVAVANLRWEGGGGIKITSNKFNGATQPGNGSAGKAQYCIQVLAPDGTNTGSLIITGNSISSYAGNTSNVYIGQLGPTKNGGFTSISITSNEVAVGNQGIFIEGNVTYDDKLSGINIAENVFSFMTTSSIKVRYVRSCRVGPNMHNGAGTPLIDIPDLNSNCVGLRVERQHFSMVSAGLDIIRDNRALGLGAVSLQGGVDYDYTQGVNCSVNGTWVQLFKIEVPSYSAGKLRIDIDGRSQDATNTAPNRKGLTLRQERSYDVNNVGAVTVAAIGTDVAAGVGSAFAALRYTVTTNFIAVEISSTDAVNSYLLGTARLRVNGKLQTFHIGT